MSCIGTLDMKFSARRINSYLSYVFWYFINDFLEPHIIHVLDYVLCIEHTACTPGQHTKSTPEYHPYLMSCIGTLDMKFSARRINSYLSYVFWYFINDFLEPHIIHVLDYVLCIEHTVCTPGQHSY